MNHSQLHIDPLLLAKEVKFTMSSSSGNGGQNVNRVATKATLHFLINQSDLFNEQQKALLFEKLKNRISKEGYLVISSQVSRSAQKNKKAALAQLLNLLVVALTPQKVRKKVKLPRGIKEKRLANKKRNSEKKELRRKVF
ncbi:MAG: alternative ribosome rescue aminoacyl-tRNA hydrolase ArfB [Saprospiraceae bacterium]